MPRSPILRTRDEAFDFLLHQMHTVFGRSLPIHFSISTKKCFDSRSGLRPMTLRFYFEESSDLLNFCNKISCGDQGKTQRVIASNYSAHVVYVPEGHLISREMIELLSSNATVEQLILTTEPDQFLREKRCVLM